MPTCLWGKYLLTIRRLPFAAPAVLASALFAAMYLFTALPRVFYPYDLDFIEDSMLMQSLRFAQGRPVYIAPTADFVPHVYMPLYSWLGGLAFRLAAPGFAPLRLLSLAATLGAAALLYYIAHRESGQHWLAFACAALYLGGYRISGFWYELARVDSLAVFLSLCGLALAIYNNGFTTRLLLAATTLALAFFAKQTALAYGFGLMPYLWLSHGKRAVLFVVVWVALIIAPLAWLNANTGGWFIYHTFRAAGGDEVQLGRAVHFAAVELFGWMIPLSLMIAGAAALAVRRNGWRGAAWAAHPWVATSTTSCPCSPCCASPPPFCGEKPMPPASPCPHGSSPSPSWGNWPLAFTTPCATSPPPKCAPAANNSSSASPPPKATCW